MGMTEEQQKAIVFLKKEKWTTPMKLGRHLGKYSYDASSFGHKLLKELITSGKVKKEGHGREVKYSLS